MACLGTDPYLFRLAMEDPQYDALLAQLSEAFLVLCDEAEMLNFQSEDLLALPSRGAGAYRAVLSQKIAEVHALERYIEARRAVLSYIEKSPKEATLAANRQASTDGVPSLGLS